MALFFYLKFDFGQFIGFLGVTMTANLFLMKTENVNLVGTLATFLCILAFIAPAGLLIMCLKERTGRYLDLSYNLAMEFQCLCWLAVGW